ncbi:unnamed protein product [Miscanthus lutarioriparius]|uniref:Uncharacterized protein n=1 Tax=Miscanthus lutarioriparius TaxID=422564 RepID=A0A811NUH0_9POAL|nr:unnamed protein product [Miscanthus lutarioriparius]
MAQGWSSLLEELVNRVADCLIATSDLDYYMDLRGVCRHWRFSTADPRSYQQEPRFRTHPVGHAGRRQVLLLQV